MPDPSESSGPSRRLSTPPPTANRSLVDLALQAPAKISNTPRKTDSTLYTGFTTAHFDAIRPLILDTMGPTLHQYKVPDFLSRAVPEVSDKVVERTYRYLKNTKAEGGTETVIAPNGRWKWFKDATPSQMNCDEDTAFKPFEYISEAILKAAETTWSEKGNPTARFRCRPRKVSNSDTENSRYKTDADQERVEKTNPTAKEFECWDSVTNAEFKKRDDSVEDSNECARQLLGNASHKMFSDPRRRFRFGLTITNASTRFWFFSRAISFVSEAFDFIKDPKPLIQFILATSFASKEEMGYDLTVERVRNDAKEWVYDYEVVGNDGKSTWYRTVKSLWTHQSGRIPGRGIRVWEVQELDEHRKPATLDGKLAPTCVLKDYWLTYDAVQESVRQKQIIDLALSKNSGLERKDIGKYFMTILHDTYVRTRDAEGQLVEDNSHVHLRGWPISDEYSEFPLETPPSNEATKAPILNGVNSRPTGNSQVRSTRESSQPDRPERSAKPSEAPPKERVYEPRRHCRIVFKEVGTRLDNMSNQRELLQSLMDALQGLKYFYDAGFLHRDISVGNLLWCYDSYHGGKICKITDLEYTRPHLQSNEKDYCPHDHKTGTPAFMALEVQANGYLFADPPEDSDGSSDEDGDASSDEEGAGFEEDMGSSAEVLFLHNYLHDVEGIWWIMIYNLYYTQPRNPEHEPAEWEQKQRIATAETIFPPSISGSTRREHFVTTKRRYVDCTKTLPPEFKALGRAMDKVRRVLLRHYRSLEYPSLKDVLDAYEKYGKIYRKLITRFKKMKKYAVESVVELGAATEEDVQVSKRTMCGNKRKNNDDGEYQPPKKTRTSSTEASRRNPGARRARRVTASKTPIAMEEGSEDEDMN